MDEETNGAHRAASGDLRLCDACVLAHAEATALRLGSILVRKLESALRETFHFHFNLGDVGPDTQDRFASGFLTICNGKSRWELFLVQYEDGLVSLMGDHVAEHSVDLIDGGDVISALFYDAKSAFMQHSRD